MQNSDAGLTLLIDGARGGDAAASERLFAVIYDELRALAGSYGKRQSSNWTMQPTAVVHEAYVKLFTGQEVAYRDRAHFFAVAATAMRQILIDHARAKKAQKRGGEAARVTLDEGLVQAGGREIDLVSLADALETLAQFDERKHRIVELRFFGGLTVEEVAGFLGLGTTTVESEWRSARAWLATRLG
jgi:RNA polymerase sigma-70 factor, ECF subfamily